MNRNSNSIFRAVHVPSALFCTVIKGKFSIIPQLSLWLFNSSQTEQTKKQNIWMSGMTIMSSVRVRIFVSISCLFCFVIPSIYSAHTERLLHLIVSLHDPLMIATDTDTHIQCCADESIHLWIYSIVLRSQKSMINFGKIDKACTIWA